jgi:hypothetical protein
MKRIALIAVFMITIFSCKTDKKQEVDIKTNQAKSYNADDGYITMKGDFIYDATQNAGILQTSNNEIYGIVIDDIAMRLNEKVKPFKTNKYTSVPVTIRVKRIENTTKNSAWKYNVEVKDILKVEAPNKEQDIIKIGE